MRTWDVYWAPEGRAIATVSAASERSAIRKARKYLGEMYAVERKAWDRSGCMEQVCFCHDETAEPYSCGACGCRAKETN